MSEQETGGEKKPALEEHFANLETLITNLEEEDITLEKAFELYKKGLDEVKAAQGQLDAIEKSMLVLNENGELEEFG